MAATQPQKNIQKNIKTRPLEEKDLDAVAAIYNHEILHGTATFDTEKKSSADVRAWLVGRLERCPALVAVDGAAVVGFAALYPWSPRKAYDATAENTVYVHADHRGRGIGKILMAAVLEQGRAAGLHTIIARVSTENAASIQFHVELGFEKVGTMREVGRKFDRLLDVDLMQLMLDADSGTASKI